MPKGCSNKKGAKTEVQKNTPTKTKKKEETCPLKAKLVKITVIQNATQTNVTGAKNWACVKKATDDVIVEATTSPNNNATEWEKIKWSGDSGAEVPGQKNQRKLSRATSKKFHVKAELGGVKDELYVWVLWAEVTILTSGTTPVNSTKFGTLFDGTESLGATSYNSGNAASGKVAPFAIISPTGVNAVVKSGWAFKRDRWTHDWIDGIKNIASNYWNTTWVDDTSSATWMRLIPDVNDKIYDLDGPNIAGVGTNDAETYNNFRQWIEWNNEKCSDYAEWYWRGRWKRTASPQVTLKDVGTGNVALPNQSHFHP